MKNYRPSFGTIFIGLFALLLGTGALLTAFGFNVFFSPRLNFTWRACSSCARFCC